MEKQFYELFKGSDLCHTRFKPEGTKNNGTKVTGTSWAIRAEADEAVWKEHLAGEIGVGIIPINSSNEVHFGVIDIDDYTLDPAKIAKKLYATGFPCVVCRSKSGGIHTYFFFQEAVLAKDVIPLLQEIAAFVEHGDAEIFPKQKALLKDKSSVGSGLNMPYFNAKRSMRYAVGPNGDAMSAEAFLDWANQRKTTLGELAEILQKNKEQQPTKSRKKKELAFPDGPPCLNSLAEKGGFPEGSRNNAVYNLSVYAKKFSNNESWADQVRQYNDLYVDPPLSTREVDAVIKQVERNEYIYKCNEEPIARFCNKTLCMSRRCGIGSGAHLSFLSQLTKLEGDPPLWIALMNDSEIPLTTRQLYSQNEFGQACMEAINQLPPAVKDAVWREKLQSLLDSCMSVPAESFQKKSSRVYMAIDRFLRTCVQVQSMDEMFARNRSVFVQDPFVWFPVEHFLMFLAKEKANLGIDLSNHELRFRLKELDNDVQFLTLAHSSVVGIHQDKFPRLSFDEVKVEEEESTYQPLSSKDGEIPF